MNRISEFCDKFDATVQFMFLCHSIFFVRLNSVVVEGQAALAKISIRRFLHLDIRAQFGHPKSFKRLQRSVQISLRMCRIFLLSQC